MVSVDCIRRVGLVALASSVMALAAATSARAADETPSAPVAAIPAPTAVPTAEPAAAAPQAAPTSVAAVEPTAAPAEILTPGETPAPVAAVPPPAAPPVAVVAPPAVPVADPVLIAVRDRLAKPVPGMDKADQAALVAYYATRTEGPAWTSNATYTAPAQAVLATLQSADDWGLDAKAFAVPPLAANADDRALADADIALSAAVLKYARQASGGRVDPSTLSRFNDHRGTFADPLAAIRGVSATKRPDVFLQALHPQNPQFMLLQQALMKARHGGAPKEEVAAPEPVKLSLASGPAVKPGATHPDVAAIRAKFAIAAQPGAEDVYDKALASAVMAFQEERGLKANGVLTPATRTALNGGDAKKKVASDPARDIQRIVLNMERWRWLPADLGAFHIENNVPEYQTRVFKDGAVVHQEKIIVGKTNTPTSLFSANMQFVIFHPEWGVPDSIKLKEIWPSLRRKPADDFFGFSGAVSDTAVLKRHNLRVSYNGKQIDASQVDWTKVDPRSYQFIQPAGGTNVLGVVKFRFPNRHDIYMHDTPQRDLFTQKERAFSHGCMRVNNPQRLAEVILAYDRGWAPERVTQQIASHQSLEVKLEKPLMVHVTYFTARVDETGKVQTFADLYGHDAKLAAALSGNPVRLEDPSVGTDGGETVAGGAQAKKVARKGAANPQADASLGNLIQGLFGN